MSRSFTPELMTPSAEDVACFEQLFELTSAIGATPAGGLNRVAASAEDGEVRDLFCNWLKEHDFEVKVDEVGNIFGLMTFDPEAPYIVCGSHLDSQPHAGRFDGVYGVLSGAVAVVSIARQLKERGETPAFNLAVVNWTNEEGARFQPSLTGSSVFTGALSRDEAWALRDGDGISFKGALEQIGYLGTQPVEINFAGYVEIHVEQGTTLESRELTVGVVRGTWAALKQRVHFIGEQNHTGPTPMALRKDAMLAAAHAVVAVRAEADLHGLAMHTSVGRVEVLPNSPNIVPSDVTLLVEHRSLDTDLLAEADERFQASLQRICADTKTEFEIESHTLRQPNLLHDGFATLATQVGQGLELSIGDSETVAGHDAIAMSRKYPVCLLFIPSRNGVSHNEAEYTTDEDMRDGFKMLTALLHQSCISPNTFR